jgi:hypothetical protein
MKLNVIINVFVFVALMSLSGCGEGTNEEKTIKTGPQMSSSQYWMGGFPIPSWFNYCWRDHSDFDLSLCAQHLPDGLNVTSRVTADCTTNPDMCFAIRNGYFPPPEDKCGFTRGLSRPAECDALIKGEEEYSVLSLLNPESENESNVFSTNGEPEERNDYSGPLSEQRVENWSAIDGPGAPALLASATLVVFDGIDDVKVSGGFGVEYDPISGDILGPTGGIEVKYGETSGAVVTTNGNNVLLQVFAAAEDVWCWVSPTC